MPSLRPCLHLVALALALPAVAHAADGPSLKVVLDDDNIYALFANTHDQPIKLRTDFLLDRVFGGLAFDIQREGTTFPITAHIDPVVPSESTYTVLTPGAVTGQMFDLRLVASFYFLKKGCYTISAIYHDGGAKDLGGFGGEVKSTAIPFCVGKPSSPTKGHFGANRNDPE